MRCDTQDPVNYAMTWMRNSRQVDPEDTRETFSSLMKKGLLAPR